MSKIIVTHKSPDMDGITSVWLIKKFLSGWENAKVEHVLAGDKMKGKYEKKDEIVEIVDDNEVIHVDTGLGRLDHHQTPDKEISAASLTFDYVKKNGTLDNSETKKEAVKRMIDVVVDDDHFQYIYYPDSTAYFYDFSLFSILDGLKMQNPGQDEKYVEFGLQCLDAILHTFENRVWAEKELKEKGIEFGTKWGKGIGVETLNDTVLELGQKSGYVMAIRKDPNTGFMRIKSKPRPRKKFQIDEKKQRETDVDLTPVFEKLKEMDPYATWYLHVSRRMLLNGSSKNPNAIGTKLSLSEIIRVIEGIK